MLIELINKPRKFRLHFNRINMQRGLDNVWTIHLSDRCIPASEVRVEVPITTIFKPLGRQPRAWFAGTGYIIEESKGKFLITLDW